MRTVLLGSMFLALAVLVVPHELSARDCSVTQTSCPDYNSTGGQNTGSGNVKYDEDGCLESWDCYYSDGMKTRYIVLPE